MIAANILWNYAKGALPGRVKRTTIQVSYHISLIGSFPLHLTEHRFSYTMHFSSFIPFVALFVTGASAAVPLSPLFGRVRQQLTTPDQCLAQCDGALDSLTVCADYACVCGVSVSTGLAKCFECGVQYVPDMKTELLTYWDLYSQECAAAGYDVGTLNIYRRNMA
ncbi:hypothetical protein FRC02_006514 [Tulasnella sp. 418]|nr:hypothetical protein FRC02_006514 [Tulasnella sp. 418]